MKKILVAIAIFSVVACQHKEVNLTVSGNIKGLKKGKLFLQKVVDTALVDIDSIDVYGDENYTLEAYIKEPELMFLYLDKIDGQRNDDVISFFAESGMMTINSKVDNFTQNAKITGSKNQELLEEYTKMMRRFNDANLDLFKENFDAQKSGSEDSILAVEKKYENNLRRKYLYSVNFAIQHKDKEVAPFIILSEVFDANIKYLDTVYKSLDKNIQKSKYGKELKDLIKEQKKLHKLDEKVSE
ncbi:DUF4369 domain-containing protein [Mesonia sp. K7]|uniref:DUF4369 domain-containing protein n=1 Tax=Mesonia sp. K7 TaxID=2218606 RepID=UPI000DA80BD9|nr:DUF4369 domain-containing protein [Mesonia sp. K7]PZD76892.1 hypothetical protein DNG35_10410 [Mesonia sp. K7]